MKLTKKIMAIVLVAAMLVTPWSTAQATTYTSLSYTNGYTVVDGVNYEKYTVYGSTSGHSETATVLEFHPDDGYIPMAFAAHAGSVDTLDSQFSTAESKYGYEVVGIINGSYFDTSTGTLTGMLVSGGKLSSTAFGYYSVGDAIDVVAFGYDGSMNCVTSQLSHNMYINGTLVPNALRLVNKAQSDETYRTDAIFYYDTSCGSYADSSYGYEIVCKKVDGTDLAIGKTMKAEVVQINGYTSGSAVSEDTFVLSTPSNSSYIGYLTGVSVGDTVEISVEETIAESKEIMEKAASAITNVGFLVKDGVDITDYNSTIGDHSVSGTYARWTAFGTKADGTYVYFTSEGGDTGNSSRSLTLKDVASAMINLGCTNVIRLDGGGSTAMYLTDTGYAMSSSRAVADCLMVVKKTSDMTLKESLVEAETISHTDYAEDELAAIRTAYESAKAVYNDDSSTDAELEAAAEALNSALANRDTSKATVDNGVYITGMNAVIGTGSSVIYTSDFNGGQVTPDLANHKWTYNVILTWDDAAGAYVLTEAAYGSGDSTPTYTLTEDMIMIAVHKDESSAASVANYNLLTTAQVGQVLNLYGIDVDTCSLSVAPYLSFSDAEEDPEVPEEPAVPQGEDAIKYQKRNDSDMRFIAYVDKLENYSSVSFTLAMDGKKTDPIVCTTAYSGLYANGVPKTTEDIYKVDGYFVTHTINGLLTNIPAGQELKVIVTYTKLTGETITYERIIIPVPAEEEEEDEPVLEPVTVTGNLTYANGYTDDWSDETFHLINILAFASSDSTATPLSVVGQSTDFFQWWYGIVFEYDETNETWKVVATDWENDATNTVEAETLGSNRFTVVLHVDATGDNVDFLKTYATVGAEFTLNTDISTLQSASGTLSDVTLSYTYYVEVEDPDEGGTTDPDEGGTTDPDEGGTTDPDEGGTTTPIDPTGITAGQITSMNYYQWVDSNPQANHIYGYATTNSSQTPQSTFHASYNLFGNGNGIVLQYNSSTGKYKVITSDLDTTDGVNAAETQALSSGLLVILFSEEAATGQPEAYSFFKTYGTVGTEFYLSTELEYIQYSQGTTGSVSNLYLSLLPIEADDDDSTTVEPADPIVGTVSSTVTTYKSTGSCTRSYGDEDGLSAVLYAPSGSIGISTWLNLGAVDTTLYASEEALAKQALGAGTASDTDVDNAYLYLCMNSTNWSGDFGLIKRLGDEDWEIVTSEYFNSTWRWNKYSHDDTSDITFSYNEDYLYWKYNVMDGRKSLYIKDSANIGDLQMNLINSGSNVTFSIVIGTETVFSMTDSTTISSLVLGRAASLTNSNTTSYGSSNYLYQIASSYMGKTPAEMTNVQFYDTYYYTSSDYDRLTIDAGALWLYPNSSSNAGYTSNKNGDPIVTCQEVLLSNGVYMDIIDISNY